MAPHSKGGPRIPTATLAARGSQRVRFRAREPVYPRNEPKPPPRVVADPLALDKWELLIPILRAGGTLNEATGILLGTLAMALAAGDRFDEELARTNYAPTITEQRVGSDGRARTITRANPVIRMANANQVRQLCSELRLSPTSSPRAYAVPVDDDPFERFIARGRP